MSSGRRVAQAEKARVRIAYERGDSYPSLEATFGYPEITIYNWARKGGWSSRARARSRNIHELHKAKLAEDARREHSLYGPWLDAVRFLRSRGWVVTRGGNGLFDVGHKRLDEQAMAALVARERRLAASRTVWDILGDQSRGVGLRMTT